VLFLALVSGPPNSSACLTYCADLAAVNSEIFFSELVYFEIGQAFREIARRPHMRGELDATLVDRFQLQDWSRSAKVRKGWLEYGESELSRLLRQFHAFTELPIDGVLIGAALQLMAECDLTSNDALHVATANLHEIEVLASVDDDFVRAVDFVDEVLTVRDTGIEISHRRAKV